MERDGSVSTRSGAVSDQEFANLADAVVRRLQRRRSSSRVQRLAVWVNGSASSIALAVLAAKLFTGGASKVFAVVTPLAEKIEEFERVSGALRQRGLEVVNVTFNRPGVVPSIRDVEAPAQLPFVLRELVKLETRTLLTWHSRDHQVLYHLASMLGGSEQLLSDEADEIVSHPIESPHLRGGRLQHGVFDLFRPVLHVPTSRLEATCEEHGIRPAGEDYELCSVLRTGLKAYGGLTDEERTAAQASLSTIEDFVARRRSMTERILRHVIFEANSRGMIVLHCGRLRNMFTRDDSVQNAVYECIMRILLIVNGSQAVPTWESVVRHTRLLLLSKYPLGFTLARAQFLVLTAESWYLQVINNEIVARNLARGPDDSELTPFEDGELVAVFRERSVLGRHRNLQEYSLGLNLNETKVWDNRYIISATVRPPESVIWPSSQLVQPHLPPENSASWDSNPVGPKEALMALLDDVCNDRPTVEGGRVPEPFVVTAFTEADLAELTERHDKLIHTVKLIPRPLLWSLPCFRRSGEILAVPSFGINYEPGVVFSAHLLFHPAMLPDDLDPSFSLEKWI